MSDLSIGHLSNNRQPVELSRCSQLLNHGPVTLVTSAHKGRRDIMAASWAMALDFNPPKVIVIMDSNTLTRKLVDASGEFGLQLPLRAIAAQTLAVGSHSGKDLDKFSAFNLNTFASQKLPHRW